MAAMTNIAGSIINLTKAPKAHELITFISWPAGRGPMSRITR
jgi:hypothetical protein